MDGEFNTHGSYKCLQHLSQDGRTDVLSVDVRIILKFFIKKEGVCWIYVAQYRDQLRSFVNTAVNLRVQ